MALRLPEEAHLEPPLLCRALEVAALGAGATLLRSRVRQVLHDGAQVYGVAAEDVEVMAPRVVIAAGSWSSLIEGTPLAARAVRPMRGQLVELEARPVPFRHVVYAPGGYLVPRPDGRVVVGSTMEMVGYRKEVTAAGLGSLLHLGRRVVPLLAGAPVLRFWSGLRPCTGDHLPILGGAGGGMEGLYFATGHLRSGILLTPITTDAVAALVMDELPPVDLEPFSAARLARDEETVVRA
jgi:glycine oxidase